MTTVGIDKINFYTPRYYLDLATLAKARALSVDKFYQGLGQYKMSIVPPDEDIITMGATAANRLLSAEDKHRLRAIYFATETSVDQSKAAAVYLHKLLELPESCRAIEIKQACYSSTAAIQLAVSHVTCHPEDKILIVASDIARYGFDTVAESSQGGGAIAILITANPRLLIMEDGAAYCTRESSDFWRPNYRDFPIVDGKYSISVYLDLLKSTWQQYCKNTGRSYYDHAQYCYHNPVPKLVEKAHKLLLELCDERLNTDTLNHYLEPSLIYSRSVGNCYTAALYLSLLSILDNHPGDLSNKRIGLYSYGSGSVAEYFSMRVAPCYQSLLATNDNLDLIESREELSYEAYKALYSYQHPTDGSSYVLPEHQVGDYRLTAIEHHKRIYTSADT